MKERQGRSYWLDYLRGFITILVVAHHSSLAYTTFASFNPQAYNASTHPIVDAVRSKGLDIFEDFNDVFFMSLMFLISGIFVAPSLARKGRRQFIRDRFRRLFIPFLIAVTFIMPIGYLASWRLAHGNYDLHDFIVDYIKIEHWPAGPPWFIGILFIFNCLVMPVWLPRLNRLNQRINKLSEKPWQFFGLAYLTTLVLFLPFVLIFGGSAWFGIGPIAFQLSRIVLYFGYFYIGMAIGASGPGSSTPQTTTAQTPTGAAQANPMQTPADATQASPMQTLTGVTQANLMQTPTGAAQASPMQTPTGAAQANPMQTPADTTQASPMQTPADTTQASPMQILTGAHQSGPLPNTLLSETSAVMRLWPVWVIGCIVAYTALKLAGGPIQNLEDHGLINETQARLLYRPIWSLSCAASCIAFITLFRRLFHRSFKFWESLSANAYGIYLVHYVFVLWIQYLLIPVSLSAVPKFFAAFLGSLALSWLFTALVRKIAVVSKYL